MERVRDFGDVAVTWFSEERLPAIGEVDRVGEGCIVAFHVRRRTLDAGLAAPELSCGADTKGRANRRRDIRKMGRTHVVELV